MNKNSYFKILKKIESSFTLYEHLDYQKKGTFQNIRNKFKTSSALQSITHLINDFDKEDLVVNTHETYRNLMLAVKRKDKNFFYHNCTEPMKEFLEIILDNKYTLPFTYSEHIKNLKIVSARVFHANPFEINSLNTFY